MPHAQVYFWVGKNFCRLQSFILRQLLRCIGWLGKPVPTNQTMTMLVHNNLGLNLKNWHVSLGE